MSKSQRATDIILALVLAVALAPVFILLIPAVLITQGRPVFFGSIRAQKPGKTFRLWKFRTMAVDSQDKGVSGGDKAHRITRIGHILRRYRLDEIPQLWNILVGDISFVGPRPPLPEYVDAFPDLYARVLQNRPGVTGLATLVYHRTEERLLAQCRSPAQTQDVYTRRCIPRKAALDLIYARNRTFCSDLVLIAATGMGRRLRRLR